MMERQEASQNERRLFWRLSRRLRGFEDAGEPTLLDEPPMYAADDLELMALRSSFPLLRSRAAAALADYVAAGGRIYRAPSQEMLA